MENNEKDSVDTTAISVDQAHSLLGGNSAISRAAFYQAVKRREVPSLRLGKRILIPRHAFLQWLQGQGAAGVR